MEIFWTNGKGHGLKALEDISDGEFIIEYLGEVVTTKEFTKRSHEYSKQVISNVTQNIGRFLSGN